MKLASLFSGGKDSTYAVYEAGRAGHEVSCLLTAHPYSAESHLLHYPATRYVQLQAESMAIPWRGATAPSSDDIDEDHTLDILLEWAIKNHNIGGIVHGGVRSRFQLRRFGDLCRRHDLELVSPLWGRDVSYVEDMIHEGFRFALVSVSAGGLDDMWLGHIPDVADMIQLANLSGRYGLAIDFEGGEAETFVVDCPIFRRPIMLCGTSHWDGYSGRFEISDATIL